MAKLTDIESRFEAAANTITTMSFVSGYLFEQNVIANKGYPLVIFTPPDSVVPDLIHQFEDYDIVFYIYTEREQDDSETLMQKWEQLKDWAWDIIDYVRANTTTYIINPKAIRFTLFPYEGNDRTPAVKIALTLHVKECRNR